jgi:hypothetical protein
MMDIGNLHFETYCPRCYKLKKTADKGGVHCDACVAEGLARWRANRSKHIDG